MLATVKPEKALELLEIEHDAVQALIDELTEEEMTRPDTIEYGLYPDQELSFKDLLAHLTCYECYAVEAVDAWRQGEQHWASAAMRTSNGGRQIHYGGIADRAHLSLDEMIEEWETTQQRLMRVIEGISDDEWQQAAPFKTAEPTDLGGMLEAILVAPPRPLYRHLPVHIPDPRKYVLGLRGGDYESGI